MKPTSGRRLCRLAENHGWSLIRIHGSHHIYGKAGSKVILSIPVHGEKPLRVGTLRSLLRLAGLSEKDL